MNGQFYLFSDCRSLYIYIYIYIEFYATSIQPILCFGLLLYEGGKKGCIGRTGEESW